MSVGLAYNQRAYTIRNDKQREAKHGHLGFYTAPGIYSASMTPIQESLGASYEVAMLGLSLFVIAYG
jgi:hypothetical protein